MTSIAEKAIQDATKQKSMKKNEDRQQYLVHLFNKLDELLTSEDKRLEQELDDEYDAKNPPDNVIHDQLPDEAQHWFRKCVKADNRQAPLPDFTEPEDVDTEGEEAEEAEDGDTEEETEEAPSNQSEDDDPEDDTPKESDVATKSKSKSPKSKPVVAKKKSTTKFADKPAKKAKAKSNGTRKVGVMSEIKRMLQRPEGASTNEIVASLVKKFPERQEKIMRNSTQWFISAAAGGQKQFGRKAKKTIDDKRGKVFRFPA